jgi:hypothetical protein
MADQPFSEASLLSFAKAIRATELRAEAEQAEPIRLDSTIKISPAIKKIALASLPHAVIG